MRFDKVGSKLPFTALLFYLFINTGLIFKFFLVPDTSSKTPWLAIILTIGLSIYLWKAYIGNWPISALITMGVITIGTWLLFTFIVMLPENGFISRLIKMVLAVSGVLILLPFGYHFGKNFQLIHPKNMKILHSENSPFGFQFSKPQIILLWGGLIILVLSYFVIPVFLRSDIIGWDTPTHLFRARLVDAFSISVHAQNAGGFQITFPLLSVAMHRLTGMSYFDIVRLLPSLMMIAIGLGSGYFAFLLYRSQLFAVFTSLFTFAWVLSPWMISNLFDNLMVAFFGILFLICFVKSQGKNAWLFEIIQIILLIFVGISHLTLSSIFFITIFHVNFLELYTEYWQGDRKNLVSYLWKAIRVPLVGGIIVLVIWFPELLNFINSLAFGLRTHAELGPGRDPSFSWIIKRYNLTLNLPWILLGYIVTLCSIFYKENNRSMRIVFAWSTVCLIFGFVLQPISFLNSRFLIMSPFFILIPLGFNYLLSNNLINIKRRNFITLGSLVIILMCILFAANSLLNAKLLIEIPGLELEDYKKINYINQFISANHSSPPFVFLVEDTGPLSETTSDLDLRVLRSMITNEGLVNSYIYFGTLDFLLKGEATPIEENGLPQLKYANAFSNASQRWFDILNEKEVLESPKMTVFIIDTYNQEIYDIYKFLPVVDKVGPGILVINIPDDLNNLSLKNWIAP
ncbi:MAG: hypothetical protein ACYDH1_12285 [Anaerolineaceae bacterium]